MSKGLQTVTPSGLESLGPALELEDILVAVELRGFFNGLIDILGRDARGKCLRKLFVAAGIRHPLLTEDQAILQLVQEREHFLSLKFLLQASASFARIGTFRLSADILEVSDRSGASNLDCLKENQVC